MRIALVMFVALTCLGAEVPKDRQCHFTAGARIEKSADGIRTTTVAKQWRGMEDEYWVGFEVRATYPQFSEDATPAAVELNRIIRDDVDDHLAAAGCPEDARLPTRQRKLIDASSHVWMTCEAAYLSRTFASLRCSTTSAVLLSGRPSSGLEAINVAIDGRHVRKLETDEIFLKGAERDRLYAAMLAEIQRQDSADVDSKGPYDDQPDELRNAVESPVFFHDRVELDYSPDRFRYYRMRLPYAQLASTLDPKLRVRLRSSRSIIRIPPSPDH
jgi:hypothetical protein